MSTLRPLAPLPNAVSGERTEFQGRAGNLSYYVAGNGRPLLLLHSINAAASVAEVAPVFEYAKTSRRVYAADLPGFGFSERSDRDYCVELYVDALSDLLDQISIGDSTPVDVLALSLSCEFVSRLAAAEPERFGALVLVSPTGLRGRDIRRAQDTREVRWLYQLLNRDWLGERLFHRLTRPRLIRYFLRRTWGGGDIDESLYRYAVITASQPGAWHAPIAFLSGRLFSSDAARLYQSLTRPVWMPHGIRGDFSDFSGTGTLDRNENWTIQAFETGGIPYFEATEPFFRAFDDFLPASI